WDPGCLWPSGLLLARPSRAIRWCSAECSRPGRAITLRHSALTMSPIFAHVRRQVLPLEEFIQLDLHQDVIPQARAFHPVLGQCLLGAASQALECVGG